MLDDGAFAGPLHSGPRRRPEVNKPDRIAVPSIRKIIKYKATK